MKSLIKNAQLLVAGALLFASTQVLAHAHLKKATPEPNSTVTEAPKSIEISFSETPETALSKIEVKNENGEIISTGKAVEGSAKSSLSVALRPMTASDKGKIHVSWKAVTPDTHHKEGEFDFTFSPQVK